MTPLTKKFEIEPTVFESENVTFQCTYKNVYDYEVKLSKRANIGFRIVPSVETKVFRYENFKGLDRTKKQNKNERYCFSKENSNIEKIDLIDTDANECNYVLVAGKGEDTSRILKEVKLNDAEGFDLYERFLDAKSENDQNLTEAQYLEVLELKGREILTDDTVTINFTGKSSDYKSKWDLGDIVDVDLSECNFQEEIRIIEVEEVYENGSKNIHLTFGNPLAEKIELND